ncbi:MAG: DUF899 domain-containing protein [Woeseiaceae bacterium]|nr:DUF899 domain-containing protein [Woeseiaceae bacterium]
MTATHKVVSHEEWLAARQSLLVREKAFTRAREELAQDRRALPWEAVPQDYVFEGAEGKTSLSAMFGGRSQLVVYHFMFGPNWEAGCPHCSFWADNFNGIVEHLRHRDVTMIAVSRAAYPKLAAYRARMGWTFDWFSSGGTSFNFDYHVSFTPEDMASKQVYYNYAMEDSHSTEREGVSVFVKDEDGRLYHTYSTFARGIDIVNTAYHYLDLVPKGRDEHGRNQFWVHRRDEYDR